MIIRLLVLLVGGNWALRRKCNTISFPPLRKAFRLLHRASQNVSGCSIDLDAIFGSTPCLPHGMHGIFISGAAKIGKNCVIFQHVTIGSNTLVDSKGLGAPTIGDNVYIGAGAKIIGNVKIGNGVRIGANATVVKDVPDNCVVVSGKQFNLVREEVTLNNHYYSRHEGQLVYFSDDKWIPELDPVVLGIFDRNRDQ
jgi:serine O-acetyltransferase